MENKNTLNKKLSGIFNPPTVKLFSPGYSTPFGGNKVIQILKENNQGLTITEIVELSVLNRSEVRIILARLEGAKRIYFRQIGMAKVYFLSEQELSSIEKMKNEK